MKIIKIEIQNYRNLDGVSIHFSENINFIVGENNIGKSNLLSLLNTLFSYRSFLVDDFKNPFQPIEVQLEIKLSDLEIGHFQDLFDSEDYSKITILCQQTNIDDNIEFYHLETGSHIPSSTIRAINYVYYDSLRNPIAEINFDKGKGVGRFLKNIISNYLTNKKITDEDFLEKGKVDLVIEAVNQVITKIKSFKDFDISATTDNDLESLLSKIVVFKDGKGENLTKAGYGVQFLILVTLSILEKIQTIKQQRQERGVFENEVSKIKAISLVLGLDEPEIHLHPYMQRSLVRYLNALINNQNEEFKELIKDLFNIDEFNGQILIVTHSPNVILHDFKEIVRFYRNDGLVKVVSGSQLVLNRQLQKHLHIHFSFIKEAFFSRCAIFVEGDSEYACFPDFGKKLAIDFDDLGICLIQARGESIEQLMSVANHFGIPSVGISDRDNGSKKISLINHHQTSYRDFEAEMLTLIDYGKVSTIRNIFNEYDPNGDQREMNIDALNNRAIEKYSIRSQPFTANLKLADIDTTDKINLKAFYYTWFSINKSYLLGKIIREQLKSDEIPEIYKKVILEAKKFV